MPMRGSFDANQFAPIQIGQSHPIGKFPFTISNTNIKENKEKTGGYLEVELTSPSGVSVMRYNLWNNSPKAVEIAFGQLSTLCRAVGIMRLNYETDAAELKGGKGQMEVGYQKGEEPTPEKPNGGYTEVKRIFDANGHDPTKMQTAPQPQQNAPQNAGPQGQTLQNNGGGNWGAANPNPPNVNPPQQSWGNNNPGAMANPPNPPANNPGGAWPQQNAPQQNNPNPPWRTG